MQATEAKRMLNDAGFACAWQCDVDRAGRITTKTPKALLVVKAGKILEILSVVRGRIDDTRVAEAANSNKA